MQRLPRQGAIFPGYKCKSNCNQFPCVAYGSEKELAIREAFKGVPEVAEYWNTSVPAGGEWEAPRTGETHASAEHRYR